MRSDEHIKKDVVDSIFWDSRIDASSVQVKVEEGQVILTGEVPTYLARVAAQSDAGLIDGVRSITNELNVRYGERTTVPTDQELETNIRKSLDWDPNQDVTDLGVTVQNGSVTLEGSVDTYWKKKRAEEIAGNIAGAVGVSNKLAVVPSESILDKAIADDIISALDRKPGVDLETIDVTVDNGVVNLSGSVPSLAGERAAWETAMYTTGVVDVRNNLMIAPPS